MSDLATYFLEARKLALGIVFGQIGLALLVSAVGWLLGGPRVFVSALVGGGIGALASLAMVVSMFRLSASAEPSRILRRVYRAELYKFVITVGLFSLVLLNMDVSFGAMLGGFAATLAVYWVALCVPLPHFNPRPPTEI